MGRRALRTGDLVVKKATVPLPMFPAPPADANTAFQMAFQNSPISWFDFGLYLGGIVMQSSSFTKQISWACVFDSPSATYGWVRRCYVIRVDA